LLENPNFEGVYESKYIPLYQHVHEKLYSANAPEILSFELLVVKEEIVVESTKVEKLNGIRKLKKKLKDCGCL